MVLISIGLVRYFSWWLASPISEQQNPTWHVDHLWPKILRWGDSLLRYLIHQPLPDEILHQPEMIMSLVLRQWVMHILLFCITLCIDSCFSCFFLAGAYSLGSFYFPFLQTCRHFIYWTDWNTTGSIIGSRQNPLYIVFPHVRVFFCWMYLPVVKRGNRKWPIYNRLFSHLKIFKVFFRFPSGPPPLIIQSYSQWIPLNPIESH